MLQRRAKIGREYRVTGLSKMTEYVTEGDISVYTLWFHAMSTTLKMSETVNERTLEVARSLSKYYTVKFVIEIDLREYNKNKSIQTLKPALREAKCAYWCNCMSFNFQGMAYRAGPWSLHTQTIADRKWRPVHGANSKVCKHIAAISIDLDKFAPEIFRYLKRLDT